MKNKSIKSLFLEPKKEHKKAVKGAYILALSLQCVCSILELVQAGCLCGAFQNEQIYKRNKTYK